MNRKIARLGLLSTLAMSSGCIPYPTQWQQIESTDSPVTLTVLVPERRWPVAIECSNPADPTIVMPVQSLKGKPLRPILPKGLPLLDKKGHRAYPISVQVVVPSACFDSAWDGRKRYWFTPLLVSQVITPKNGEPYHSTNNIYTFDAAGNLCAGKAIARTRNFAAIHDEECIKTNGDGSPRRELWLMTKPRPVE